MTGMFICNYSKSNTIKQIKAKSNKKAKIEKQIKAKSNKKAKIEKQ